MLNSEILLFCYYPAIQPERRDMKTKRYNVIVDGKNITMLSLSGMGHAQALAYCRGIFGTRLQSVKFAKNP